MALTDNLQAFYKLSDTSDSSGNGNTLTNNGNVSFANGEAVFNGGGLGLTISNFVDSQTTTAFTLVYKVKANSVSDGLRQICSSAYLDGTDLWGTYQYGDTIVSFSRDVNGDNVGDDLYLGTNIVENEVYFALVVDTVNQTKTVYANGVQVGQSATGTTLRSNQDAIIVIGSWVDGTWAFNGTIDKLGIWNRALTSAEVAELYNNGTGLELDITPNLNTLVKIEGNAKFQGKVKFSE
jgi:hypothetical protein